MTSIALQNNILSQGLLSDLASQYGFATCSCLYRVEVGYLSNNFVLKGDGVRFFLKEYSSETEKRVADIHKSEYFFKDAGIPVIVSLRTLTGYSYITHQTKFYTLTPFVANRIVPRDKMSLTEVRSMAILLAKLHSAGEKFIHPGFNNLDLHKLDNFDVRSEVFLKELDSKQELSEYDAAAQQILSLKQELIKHYPLSEWIHNDVGQYTLVHGDFHERNVFFNETGEVSDLYDFGKTRLMPKLFELFRSMNFICFLWIVY